MTKNFTIKTILICPLDWGLGHATRCIPLIEFFLKDNRNVVIGCEIPSAVHSLLSKEFTGVRFVNLPGYKIQYAKETASLAIKMAAQLPKILSAIKKENKWLQKTVDELNIDLVISDNRYGLYTKKCPCVFITHQLRIQTPAHFLEGIIQKINYRFINRFSVCWVPDFPLNFNSEQSINIAGMLSHPKSLPKIPVEYLGILNRTGKILPNFNKYKFLVLISGPEPQRSLFEKKIIHWIKQTNDPVILARGMPGNAATISVSTNCTVFNHLMIDELETAFHSCQYVIARSGYTTVMEILARAKKSMLIPTPGQTEQEYLAARLMNRQWAYTFSQNDNDYFEAIRKGEKFAYSLPHFPQIDLKDVVGKIR
ncbi:MAG: glycosyl transferase family 28 [Chitinophagaceae bacterium]|jgi:uncharacterized protein (TIGR00661 family)|nr:glycosyl transferase family 28 [Chitinophagaceae bacterium]